MARRGLADSREIAQRLIMAGRVRVNSRPAYKADLKVDSETEIALMAGAPQFASRGAYKLIAALEHFGISVDGKLAMDVGASTGGFTDVLLRRGAKAVIAMDVGYGQLALKLREDPRVTVLDRMNIRLASPADLPHAPELVKFHFAAAGDPGGAGAGRAARRDSRADQAAVRSRQGQGR
jgi:23S rRNA (cytidine1920-2'-O)/16S rRNA (cytidine1409-2'-O)-methyltransferase